MSFGLMFIWRSNVGALMSLSQSFNDIYLIESKLRQPVARLWGDLKKYLRWSSNPLVARGCLLPSHDFIVVLKMEIVQVIQ